MTDTSVAQPATTPVQALTSDQISRLVELMSPEQFAALAASAKDRKTTEREARKTITLRGRKFVEALITSVTSDQTHETGLPSRVFTSGAVGWTLGGSKFQGADGKSYRAYVLIRDEATIPEKDKSEPEDTD